MAVNFAFSKISHPKVEFKSSEVLWPARQGGRDGSVLMEGCVSRNSLLHLEAECIAQAHAFTAIMAVITRRINLKTFEKTFDAFSDALKGRGCSVIDRSVFSKSN
jgi:hypothetical protein